MVVSRRSPPKVTAATKLGNLIEQRREARLRERKAAYAQAREPVDGPGEIVPIHDNEEPFTDALNKARYESRPLRQGKYLHVSDLIGKCMRKFALLERFDIQPHPQSLSLTDSLTFAQGDAIHEVLKKRAAKGAPQWMWGNWSCRCGLQATKEPCLLSEVDTAPCRVCGTPVDNYREVPMFDDELGIVGTPDVILYLPLHQAFHITELKSMAHDRWRDLVRPEPDHVIQNMFYWYLMHRKGYQLTGKPSILYATKGWQFSKSPVKEFLLDAVTLLPRLDIYLEDAVKLKEARDGGELPARICATDQAPEAKKCEACQVCFRKTDEKPKTISIQQAMHRRGR